MLRLLCAALALAGLLTVTPASAGPADPLFVNLISDDAHRVTMALTFGQAQAERGHPLTVFLNDKAVRVIAKPHAAKYGQQQKMLADLIAKGAQIIVCPMCMKHYGIKEADLLAGAKVGNPELTGGALFKDGTQTLTW